MYLKPKFQLAVYDFRIHIVKVIVVMSSPWDLTKTWVSALT